MPKTPTPEGHEAYQAWVNGVRAERDKEKAHLAMLETTTNPIELQRAILKALWRIACALETGVGTRE